MENSKGKKVVLLLIILVFVILLAAGGAYAYIATDLLKSPDMLFKKYMINEAVELFNFNIGPYKEGLKRIENEKTEIKLTGKNKFDLGDNQRLDDDNEDEAYLESTFTLKLDNPNKNQAISVTGKLDDEDYFDIELIKSEDAAGVYVEGLHDKYIVVENRNLKKLAETFEVEDDVLDKIPDQFPETSISKDEKEKIVKAIYEVISNELKTIDSKSYTQEKNVASEFEGETFKGNKYTLSISAQKLEDIINNIATNVVQNEEINAILKSKFPEDFVNDIRNNILENFKVESANKEDIIKISVYTYNGKTIKLDAVSNDEVGFEMYTINKETSSAIQLRVVLPKTESNEVASESTINIKSSFENNNGETTLEEKTTYNRNDVKKLKEKEEEDDFFFDEDEFDEMYSDSTSSIKIVTTYENNKIDSKITTTDKNKDKQTSTCTIQFGDVKVPTLESGKTIVINDYTQDDFTKLGMEILSNGAKTAEEKPNTLIGSMFGFLSNFGLSSGNDNSTSDDGFFVQGSSDLTEFDNDNIEDEDDDNETHSSGIRFADMDSNEELSLTEINQAKGNIYTAVGGAISGLLRDYRDDLEDDPNVNLGDYLGEDKIQSEAGSSIKNLQIIDGETLKCEYQNNTYFVKIYINGDTLGLDSVDVLYSADGTLENAR